MDEFLAIRAALARAVGEGRYAPATANKHLAALRGALKAAWRMGVMETDEYLPAVDLRPIAGGRLPAGRDVERSELAALLAQCRSDDTPAGVRDAAVIGLACLSGTRRAELVALHLADVATDPAALRVVGKGGKQRLVPLSPTVGPLLDNWMELRGDSAGPLFCPIDRTGNLRLGHTLSGEAIRQILSRRTLAAGLAAMSPMTCAMRKEANERVATVTMDAGMEQRSQISFTPLVGQRREVVPGGGGRWRRAATSRGWPGVRVDG